MVVFLAAASAADLRIDGDTVELHGPLRYDRVDLRNHARLSVTPYDGRPGTGTLELHAASVVVDGSSTIDGGGAGPSGDGAAISVFATDLVVWGTVVAAGAAGRPGGAVRLEADRLTCSGRVDASGGAGGAGGSVVAAWDAAGAACAADVSGIPVGVASDERVDTDGDGADSPADCDTRDPAIGPSVTESCNGRDDDCDGAVDEAAGCACAVVQRAGHGYEQCGVATADWSAAQRACAASGKHLLALEDAAEEAWFVTEVGLAFPSAQNWWIGYNDRDVEGVWTWDGGSPGTYTDWVGGTYYGGGGAAQDCVDLRTWGLWADRECGDSLFFACESCDPVLAHADADGDGYGDPAAPVWACFGPRAGAVDDATDCDDADAGAHPGAPDPIGDGVDQDCDGAWSDTGLPTGDSGSGDTDTDGDADPDADTDGDADPDTLTFVPGEAVDPGCGCGTVRPSGAVPWLLLALMAGRRRAPCVPRQGSRSTGAVPPRYRDSAVRSASICR